MSYAASTSVTSWDTLAIDYEVNSQSEADNSSNVTFYAYLVAGSSGKISSTTSKSYSATINGTTYSGTNTVGIANNATKTLFSKTLDIAHDSDGTKSFTFSYTQSFSGITFSGTSLGSYTVSCTVTLDTIARGSTITSVTSSVTMSSSGKACSVEWTPTNSDFAYKLRFAVSGKTVTTSFIEPGSTDAYTYSSYTFKTATWAPYITTATSATCTVTLYTYTSSSATSYIGADSTTFTLSVPTSLTPTVSFATEEGNSTVTSAGVTGYVQGKSKVKVTTTASGQYSATISSYAVTIGSSSYSGSEVTSSTLSSSGTVAISVTVTDSRGLSTTSTGSITVEAYSSPKISTFTAKRVASSTSTAQSLSGEYIRVAWSYSATTLSGVTNTVSLTYKKHSASSYSSLTTVSATSGNYTKNLSSTTSYDFQFTVTDAFTTVTKTVNVGTAVFPISVYPDGTGVAIGKYAETASLFDVGMDAAISGGLTVGGNVYLPNAGRYYIKDSSGTDRSAVYLDANNNYYLATGYVTNSIYIGSKNYTEAIYLRSASTEWKVCYSAGDTITSYYCGAGYVTSAKANICFMIPLSKPIIGSPTVSVAITGISIFQDGSYTHGTSSTTTATTFDSDSITATIRPSGVQVQISTSTTTNAVNNAPCGIRCYYTITLTSS